MTRPGKTDYPPLSGPALALLTIALPLATFMQVVDITIANVAVPTIAGNLGASTSQGTWIITSYAVANAIALPLTGRLAQRFGEVRLFLWATALFASTSFLCGVAPNLKTLVFFRILQGLAGGPMMPLGQSLLLNNYPQERQPMAIALWAMTVAVAPVLGPILGGFISDNWAWGWIFFINVPTGLTVLLLTYRLLKNRETPRSRPSFNLISFSLLAIGVGALQMMLDRGKELDWFNSTEIVLLALTALVGLTFLVAWELTNPLPLVDLRLIISGGFLVFAYCMYLRTGFAPNMDLKFIIWPQFIQGAALACFFVPITTLTFSGIKPQQMAAAAGLFNFIRTLFGAIGASVATTLWERREAFHHVRLSGQADPYNPIAREALRRLSDLGLSETQSAAFLARQITDQGFILAAAEIYQLCAAAFILMIFIVWLARDHRSV